jgi:regulator of protease activity HflC (stomatin/prohibitin superfamily)
VCVRHAPLKDVTLNPITAFLVLVCFIAAAGATALWNNLLLGVACVVAGLVIALSLKMANEWQKFVILRMGKLQSVKGAGMFAIIPLLDRVVAVIDGRIQTTAFNAEQGMNPSQPCCPRRADPPIA